MKMTLDKADDNLYLQEFWATTNVGGLTNARTAEKNLRKIIWIFLVAAFTVV